MALDRREIGYGCGIEFDASVTSCSRCVASMAGKDERSDGTRTLVLHLISQKRISEQSGDW